MQRVVGIAEYITSSDPDDVLVTLSLGSCLGLVLHDPVAGVGGLLHAMLPLSKQNAPKALSAPGTYVDTGAAALMQELFDRGARREHLVAKLVGASASFEGQDMFKIGERNHTMVRRVLWKNGILVSSESVGGSESRSVYLEVGSGRTLVKMQGQVTEL